MIVVLIIVVLVVGAGGFFAGMKYQQSKSLAGRFANLQGARNGQFLQQRNQGYRPVNGDVISQDDKSITVKLQDGSSKIVFFTDTTSFNKSTEGSKADLKDGERVSVLGTENSDGSVTAQSVQLNPQFRGLIGSPSAAPSK